MKRKTFLKTSLLATAGMSIGGWTACKATQPITASTNLAKLDALALAKLIQTKQLSPKELLLDTIQRIEAQDEKIGAISIRDFEAAVQRAEKIDTSLPFAGIPLLLKDGTDYEGVLRPHSCKFFQQYRSKGKSPIVKKYEALGFNFIGYSKTPEFNNCAGSTEPLLFSPCRNPHDLNRSVGASSGGAAAAIAAGYVPLAHGTDGGGSLRIPASACGVFGFAPSQYRMLSGQLDGGHNIFTRHHALSRTIRDSATLFYHTQDKKNTANLPALPLVTSPSKQRLKIGLLEQGVMNTPLAPPVKKALSKATQVLTDLGHQVQPFSLDVNGEVFFKNYFILFGEKLNAIIQAVEHTTGQKAEQTGLLEPLTIAMARDVAQYTKADRTQALAYIASLKEQVAATFQQFDCWMSPVMATLPPMIGELRPDKSYDFLYTASSTFMEFTALQNMVGAPAMAVPLYRTEEGLPVGIQFAGAVGGENLLLGLGFELEGVGCLRIKVCEVDKS